MKGSDRRRISSLLSGRFFVEAAQESEPVVRLLRAGTFLAMLLCNCGCGRVVHYTVKGRSLFYRPGEDYKSDVGGAAKFRTEFKTTITYPMKDTGCRLPEIPERWLGLSILRYQLGVSHEELDSVLCSRS